MGGGGHVPEPARSAKGGNPKGGGYGMSKDDRYSGKRTIRDEI